jgi:hypothetical protein
VQKGQQPKWHHGNDQSAETSLGLLGPQLPLYYVDLVGGAAQLLQQRRESTA